MAHAEAQEDRPAEVTVRMVSAEDLLAGARRPPARILSEEDLLVAAIRHLHEMQRLAPGRGRSACEQAAKGYDEARLRRQDRHITSFERAAGGRLKLCCIDFAWDAGVRGTDGHHPMCPGVSRG